MQLSVRIVEFDLIYDIDLLVITHTHILLINADVASTMDAVEQ